jgi:hypothetical protein
MNNGKGKTVVKALKLQPGPVIGETLQKVLEWQLENPDKTSSECLGWLLETSEAS